MYRLRLRYLATIFLAAACIGIAPSISKADSYPSKAIKVIVPTSAGGGLDTFIRILASVAPPYLNDQPLIIINKPGGAHIPGLKYVARSEPDGYTIAATAPSTVMLATMYKDQDIDFLKDFEMIANLGIIKAAVYVNNESPYNSMRDLMDAMKKQPGKLRYAHTGRNAWGYTAAEGFLAKNGLSAQDVPFKGGAKARAAIVGAQVDFAIFGVGNIKGYEDKIRVLAVLADERDAIQNQYPTMKELGIDYVEVTVPLALAAPRGTPPAVVKYLSDTIGKITSDETYLKLIKKAGQVSQYMSGTDARKYYEEKQKAWRPIVEYVKSK